MYGIYANIGGILMVNVTIYSIHGSYGLWIIPQNGLDCWVCHMIWGNYPAPLAEQILGKYPATVKFEVWCSVLWAMDVSCRQGELGISCELGVVSGSDRQLQGNWLAHLGKYILDLGFSTWFRGWYEDALGPCTTRPDCGVGTWDHFWSLQDDHGHDKHVWSLGSRELKSGWHV